MSYTTHDKVSGVNGLAVGAKGAEIPVASSAGQLYQSGALIYPMKKATGALANVDTGGGIFSWQNPESGPILVQHVVLNVTTKAAAACTVNVGTTDTGATTPSDTLIDGVDVSAATGTFTNDESAGTNGTPVKRLAAGKWVTASKASGESAGLVGTYEIYYTAL